MLKKVLVVLGVVAALVPALFLSAGFVVFAVGGDEWPPVRDVPPAGAATLGPELLDELDDAVLAAAVLVHPRIGLRAAAAADIRRGLVDARVLAVLLVLAEDHELAAVGPFVTGHSFYVAGTGYPSNHAFGRAVDIAVVDGRPVSPRNEGAREAVALVASLPSGLRPHETGCPWPDMEVLPGVFSDAHHDDHLHIGFDR